jgi:hypothetical protein
MQMLSIFLEIQGNCQVTAKRMTEQRQIQNGECYAFLLLLVNSWTQEGVSDFQQKQFEHLFHIDMAFNLKY